MAQELWSVFVDEVADVLVNLANVNVSTYELFVGVLFLIYLYPWVATFMYRSRL